MTNSEIENRVAESERALEEAIEEFNSVEEYEEALQNLDSDSPLTEEEQAILDQAVEDAHQEIQTLQLCLWMKLQVGLVLPFGMRTFRRRLSFWQVWVVLVAMQASYWQE